MWPFCCYTNRMDSIKKILIADDELAIANALALKLTKVGFEVKVSNDGVEAIKLIKEESYDLILLDLMMDKKDGFAVLEDMQNANIKTPVIVTSNLGQSEDISRAESLGAVGYFVKSDTPISEIVEKVKNILHIL